MDRQDEHKIIHRVVRRIVDHYGCAVDEVNAGSGPAPDRGRAQYLKRVLALQLLHVDELEEKGPRRPCRRFRRASDNNHERKATLLGSNALLGHAVRIVQHPREHRETSTDKIERALANLVEQKNGQGEPSPRSKRS